MPQVEKVARVYIKLNKTDEIENYLIVDQPDQADMFISIGRMIRRCTDEEWNTKFRLDNPPPIRNY